jgi:hypothetical protein
MRCNLLADEIKHEQASLSCAVFLNPNVLTLKGLPLRLGHCVVVSKLNSRKPNIMQIFTHKQGVKFFSYNLRTFYLGRGQRGVGCKHGKNMRLFVSKCLLFVKGGTFRDFKNHHFGSFARFLMTLLVQYT